MPARQLWTAVALTALGAGGVVEAWKLAIGTVAQPGPGFFPLCLAVALTLTGAGLVRQAMRQATPARHAPGPAGGVRRVVVALLALLAYVLSLDHIGFVLATFLLVAFLFRVIEPQRWVLALGGAAATAILSHVVFRAWLGVRLPPGPWGF